MPQVKPLAEIAAKFVRRASVASEDYRRGVSRVDDWQQNTLAAEGNYESGVQAAIADNRFGKGVGRVSNEEWKRKAQDKGGANYGAGVRQAEDDFSKGFAPFRSVIEGITLPPRGPKGSPENIERVRIIGQALHDAKLNQ